MLISNKGKMISNADLRPNTDGRSRSHKFEIQSKIKAVIVLGFIIAAAVLTFFGVNALTKKEDIKDKINLDQITQVVDVEDEGETDPTILELLDVEQVKSLNPTLYTGAQNGDIVIIYKTKIIIYRESTQKIINVLPNLSD